MPDDREFERRAQRRLEREIRELDNPRARHQAAVDRWWHDRLMAAEEEKTLQRAADPYGLGIW